METTFPWSEADGMGGPGSSKGVAALASGRYEAHPREGSASGASLKATLQSP